MGTIDASLSFLPLPVIQHDYPLAMMWIGMSKYFRKWPVECGSFPSLSLWQWPLSKEASLDSHSYQDDYGIKNSVWGSWFDGRRLIASPNWRLHGIGFFDSYRWACEKKGVLWNSSGYSYICTLTCCDEPQYFPYLNRYTTYNQDLPDIPCIFHANILLKPFFNLHQKWAAIFLPCRSARFIACRRRTRFFWSLFLRTPFLKSHLDLFPKRRRLFITFWWWRFIPLSHSIHGSLQKTYWTKL